MEDGLPDNVRDFKLDTRFINRREVAHLYDDPDAPPSSPRREEYWKKEKRIGGGGQGEVHLQKCTSGGRTYTHRAVKVIPIRESGIKRRFLRELETITKFSHPRYAKYFVKLLGWYESKASLCIAMEYFAHGDLQTYLGRNRLSEDDSRHITCQVLQGLAVMHREGFTHGDIKPKNILIKLLPTSEGSHTWWVKLADFGISKRMKGASGESTVIGTEEYQAPELFRGDPQGINFLATDMWSLGAMAFRILTQSPVFTNPYEAFQYLSRPESFLPGTRLDDCHVSPDGRAFTCALLQLDPAQRLDSQAALLQAWITPCLPSAPEMVSSAGDGSSIASSSTSSRRSSLDGERGMTTQLSDITDIPKTSSAQSAEAIVPRNPFLDGPDKATTTAADVSMTLPSDKSYFTAPSQENRDASLPNDGKDSTALQRNEDAITDTRRRLRDLVEQLHKGITDPECKEPGFRVPNDREERETLLMSEVVRGEILCRDPANHIEAALSFYKALKLYPNPQELTGMYEQSVPKEVLEILAEIMAIAKSLELGAFNTSDNTNGQGVSPGYADEDHPLSPWMYDEDQERYRRTEFHTVEAPLYQPGF